MMAQEGPNKLVEWWLAVREYGPTLRRGLADWWQAVRAEPVLLWETPGLRYALYGLGGLLVLWIGSVGTTMLAPPLPEGAKPEATSADFHALCSDPTCHTHFVVNREFGFRAFPVKCPTCNKETGNRAVLCTGEACTQRWVLPESEP